MLNTINVAVIKNGILDKLWAYADDQGSVAEKKFIVESKKLGLKPEEKGRYDEELTLGAEALENRYWIIDNAAVFLEFSLAE